MSRIAPAGSVAESRGAGRVGSGSLRGDPRPLERQASDNHPGSRSAGGRLLSDEKGRLSDPAPAPAAVVIGPCRADYRTPRREGYRTLCGGGERPIIGTPTWAICSDPAGCRLSDARGGRGVRAAALVQKPPDLTPHPQSIYIPRNCMNAPP